MENYLNLKIAALFHDIGKFYQRAYADEKDVTYDKKYDKSNDVDESFGNHSKWSAEFVNKYYNSTIEDLVLNHHNVDSLLQDNDLINILQKSNYHPVLGNRIDEIKAHKTPLESIFSKIKLEGHDECNKRYVPLESLKLDDSIYPKDDKFNPDYRKLWDEFIMEFESVPDFYDFETIFALVKKFTSTIPLVTYENEEDISLFDHLKTSVSLANCRYIYGLDNLNDNEDVYLIITGDISGIQDFIYRVSSPSDAQKDMSKRLRGRSLYLSLLSEAITSRIVHDLNLDSSNVLFCGGGRFTILAPNVEKTRDLLKSLDEKINKFFIDNFNAELYLALESVSASDDDLKNFNQLLSKLNGKLSENKKHKFNRYLPYLFDEKSDNCQVNDLCHVCGKPTPNEDFCDSCNAHVRLGREVANAKYMIKYLGEKIDRYTSFYNDSLNVGFIFLKNDTIPLESLDDSEFVIYSLNDTNFLKFKDMHQSNVSFDFKFFGNNVPTIGDDKTLYFEHLAQCSKGADKLGVLKMDVDNLGKIFSQGFIHLNDSNISRISSLSFNMDLFFSGLINNVINDFNVYTECEPHCDKFNRVGRITFEDDANSNYEIYKPINKSDLPNELDGKGISTIYVNYSGGDDLLVVGPYDDIIEFSLEFKRKFKAWTCENDSMSISAGIKILGSKFPIGKAAIMADEDLEKSKDCGRNKITVFNQVLAWDGEGQFYKGFDTIFKFSKELEKLREDGKISGGFVYSLLHMWEYKTDIGELHSYDEDSWLDYNKDKQSKKSFIPMLYYKLRIIKNKKTRDMLRDELKEMLPWIKVPVSWSSLRLR